GVCPFALPDEVQVYLDISLQRFERVFPAAGTAASAVDITVKALENITDGIWVDVAKEE
ncbi:MAG: YbaK/EbsC family protein, partial [Eubacteriaceae bacterium]|nr:YbaK/EbsC family protein [Eubacteriaceae bacterium]